MVPDTPQVQDVLFNQNGIAEGLTDGKLIIDMSSISPIETKEFANTIKSRVVATLMHLFQVVNWEQKQLL